MDEKQLKEIPPVPTGPVNPGIRTYAQDVHASMNAGGNVQTYVSDITKAVEGNNGAVIKNMIRQQEDDENRKKYSPSSAKNKIFVLFAVVFLVLAGVTIFIFWERSQVDDTVPVAPQYKSLIFTDHAEPAEIGGLSADDIQKSIFNLAAATTVKAGGVEGIYPTVNNEIIGIRKFMGLSGGSLALDKLPYVNENFLLGVVHYTNQDVGDIAIITTQTPPPVPTVIEGKPITLNNASFFKTGTTQFINADAKDKAKSVISEFLDGIDFTTTKINVIGTYSVERPSKANDALAESRKKLGLSILNEVLIKKFTAEEITKITITSSAKGVSVKDTHTPEEIKAMKKADLEKLIDQAQGIQYIAEAKTKSTTVLLPAGPSTTETNITDILTTSGLGYFMLLNERSFADIFQGMRDWEGQMFEDLHGFFGLKTDNGNEYLLTKPFEDGVIQNKNARVLRDNNGTIILMYVFADDNSVLITRSVGAVREVLLRLAAAQIKK